jgi:hypothetical protein
LKARPEEYVKPSARTNISRGLLRTSVKPAAYLENKTKSESGRKEEIPKGG